MALLHSEISFSHIRVSDAVGKIYKVSEVTHQPTDEWNYQFLVDALRSEKEDEETDGWMLNNISVRDVRLERVRFRYDDLNAQLHYTQMDLHEWSDEAIDAQIGAFSAELRKRNVPSPFSIEDLQAHVVLTDTLLSIPTLKAQLPKSRMDMSGVEVRFPAGDTLYLSKSAHDILISLGIRQARLTPADIAFFAPDLRGIIRCFQSIAITCNANILARSTLQRTRSHVNGKH